MLDLSSEFLSFIVKPLTISGQGPVVCRGSYPWIGEEGR